MQPAASSQEALRKLRPRELVRKPVLFVVAVGSALTTLSALVHPSVFTWVISIWLWLTVIFANFAEAVAEGRGRAQAESLRRARTDTVALRLRHWTGGRVVNVSSSLHRTASIMWNDPNRTRRYSRLAAYAQSQLALTVIAERPACRRGLRRSGCVRDRTAAPLRP